MNIFYIIASFAWVVIGLKWIIHFSELNMYIDAINSGIASLIVIFMLIKEITPH